MVVVVEKKYNKQEVNKLLKDFKSAKIFNAKQFAGKIKWEEDPCEYQKRIRNEWSSGTL